jgi:hypothetical protein
MFCRCAYAEGGTELEVTTMGGLLRYTSRPTRQSQKRHVQPLILRSTPLPLHSTPPSVLFLIPLRVHILTLSQFSRSLLLRPRRPSRPSPIRPRPRPNRKSLAPTPPSKTNHPRRPHSPQPNPLRPRRPPHCSQHPQHHHLPQSNPLLPHERRALLHRFSRRFRRVVGILSYFTRE